MKTEAETGVMLVQAKERQGFLVAMEARREAKKHLPGAFTECSPSNTFVTYNLEN